MATTGELYKADAMEEKGERARMACGLAFQETKFWRDGKRRRFKDKKGRCDWCAI